MQNVYILFVFFQILMSYWLTNGYTLQATPDYFKFNELVGEEKIAGVTEYAYYSYSGVDLIIISVY